MILMVPDGIREIPLDFVSSSISFSTSHACAAQLDQGRPARICTYDLAKVQSKGTTSNGKLLELIARANM